MLLKSKLKLLLFLCFIFWNKQQAQHRTLLNVAFDFEKKVLHIEQETTFFNPSKVTINQLILNDWNSAYANTNTVLADRFSDEFVRSFHFAKPEERGETWAIKMFDEANRALEWHRLPAHYDLIAVDLPNGLLPNQKIKINLKYDVKIPSDAFTGFGFATNGNLNLKNWWLSPSRFENNAFVTYSNCNLNDIANGFSDYEIHFDLPKKWVVTTDLDLKSTATADEKNRYVLDGKNRNDFGLFIAQEHRFESINTDIVGVETDLKDKKIDPVVKAKLVQQIVGFVDRNIGALMQPKICISQTDYDRNPFYGLNQLPAFLSPFGNDFIYELQFLRTYLDSYLKNTLRLDQRKDNWIFDGIQVYYLMQYIQEFHPESKMMGSIAKMKLLKSFKLVNLDFNDQYSYFYMLMARKNLDQPLVTSKENLIKFNEQIANKYYAGLAFQYLDSYMGNGVLKKSIQEFVAQNQNKLVSKLHFEQVLKSNTTQNIDWFFDQIVAKNQVIDFKFKHFESSKDSLSFEIKSQSNLALPIPIYGIKNKSIVFKQWIETTKTDSVFRFPTSNIDHLVINFNNEVPEINLRNNWKKIGGFLPNNRPFKFVFMKDLEDPKFNQVLYVPTITYNLYDGVTPGFRMHNKAMLDKPFTYDINPAYSLLSKKFIGGFSAGINQNFKDQKLYNVFYGFSGSYSQYAPDAGYSRFNPAIYMRFRPEDLRSNQKQLIAIRQVVVHRDKLEEFNSDFNENYSVFDVKYIIAKSELIKQYNFVTDFQISKNFGKMSVETGFRKLFDNNRQLSFRTYFGAFLYNQTDNNYFSFAIDRPTDYLFDYNYYGRSESSGVFSQQLILAEGGFKSKLTKSFANQLLATTNIGYTIWNWIEAYGDLGFIKNTQKDSNFIYDSGIRLNLVQDYFEIYLPVYSNNGWEIAQPNFSQKIRFIATIDPRVLINLFTRKWL